jgi:hypothetical protein
MNRRLRKSVALITSLVLLLVLIVVPNASAASQTMTLSMPTVTTSGFTLSLQWSATTGASYYDIRYETDPNVNLSTSTSYTTSSGTAISSTMSSSIGYRFFRVYAYNSAHTLLAYSNVIGIAKYQTGLVIRMKTDSALTNSYPDPAGSGNAAYYQRPVWFITINATVLNSYVAPNFKVSEFITESITSALIDPLMVQHVQNARNRYGAMTVNSGYRTPAHNAAIGGATYSRHMYGDAIDIAASTLSQWQAQTNAFAPENPSYVETYAEGGSHHYHGDWRYQSKGYQNW